MSELNMGVIAVACATMGQVLISLSLLIGRSAKNAAYVPLAAVFTALGFLTLPPIVLAFHPAAWTYVFSLSLPAYLILGPCFWLYIRALTSEREWHPNRHDSWHFVLGALGLVAALLCMNLPIETQRMLLIEGRDPETSYVEGLMLFVFALIAGWTIQSGVYVALVVRRLAVYRARLKDIFASTDGLELGWVSIVGSLVAGVWLVSIAAFWVDASSGVRLVSPIDRSLLLFMTVWSLSIWGLRQKPGFSAHYQDSEHQPAPATEAQRKYARSAMGADRLKKIAGKLEDAMKQDALYMDPNLSLSKLAKHTGCSTNHISQTLNTYLDTTFFDYVNRWRIEAAIPLLRAGSLNTLEVAMAVGYNAKSSFYKAFKQMTGKTPRAFKVKDSVT